jgi:hypothetical protein
MNEFVYFTFQPDIMEDGKFEALFWSNNDGWVDWDNREVTVFSYVETLTFRPPINPNYPVISIPVYQAELVSTEMRYIFSASLN